MSLITDDEVEVLDFHSAKFDPLRALYTEALKPPIPKVRVFNNLEAYETAVSKGTDFGQSSSLPSLGVHEWQNRDGAMLKPLPQPNDVDASNELTANVKQTEDVAVRAVQSASVTTLSQPKSKRQLMLDRRERLKQLMTSELVMPTGVRHRKSKNVIERMDNMQMGPFSVLYNCMVKGVKLKVWTRRYKGIRGVCCGYLVAFDKHMNLAMIDVDEVFTLETRTLGDDYFTSNETQCSATQSRRARRKNAKSKSMVQKNRVTEDMIKHEDMEFGKVDALNRFSKADDLVTTADVQDKLSTRKECNIDNVIFETQDNKTHRSADFNNAINFDTEGIYEETKPCFKIKAETSYHSLCKSDVGTFNCKTDSQMSSLSSPGIESKITEHEDIAIIDGCTKTFLESIATFDKVNTRCHSMETSISSIDKGSSLTELDPLTETNLRILNTTSFAKLDGVAESPLSNEIFQLDTKKQEIPVLGMQASILQTDTGHSNAKTIDGKVLENYDIEVMGASSKSKTSADILSQPQTSLAYDHKAEQEREQNAVDKITLKFEDNKRYLDESSLLKLKTNCLTGTPIPVNNEATYPISQHYLDTLKGRDDETTTEVGHQDKGCLDATTVGNNIENAIVESMDYDSVHQSNVDFMGGVVSHMPDQKHSNSPKPQLTKPHDYTGTKIEVDNASYVGLHVASESSSKCGIRCSSDTFAVVSPEITFKEPVCEISDPTDITESVDMPIGSFAEKPTDNCTQATEGSLSASEDSDKINSQSNQDCNKDLPDKDAALAHIMVGNEQRAVTLTDDHHIEHVVEFEDTQTGEMKSVILLSHAIPLESSDVYLSTNQCNDGTGCDEVSMSNASNQDELFSNIKEQTCEGELSGDGKIKNEIVLEGQVVDEEGSVTFISPDNIVFELGEAIPLDVCDGETAETVVANLSIDALRQSVRKLPTLQDDGHGGETAGSLLCNVVDQAVDVKDRHISKYKLASDDGYLPRECSLFCKPEYGNEVSCHQASTGGHAEAAQKIPGLNNTSDMSYDHGDHLIAERRSTTSLETLEVSSAASPQHEEQLAKGIDVKDGNVCASSEIFDKPTIVKKDDTSEMEINGEMLQGNPEAVRGTFPIDEVRERGGADRGIQKTDTVSFGEISHEEPYPELIPVSRNASRGVTEEMIRSPAESYDEDFRCSKDAAFVGKEDGNGNQEFRTDKKAFDIDCVTQENTFMLCSESNVQEICSDIHEAEKTCSKRSKDSNESKESCLYLTEVSSQSTAEINNHNAGFQPLPLPSPVDKVTNLKSDESIDACLSDEKTSCLLEQSCNKILSKVAEGICSTEDKVRVAEGHTALGPIVGQEPLVCDKDNKPLSTATSGLAVDSENIHPKLVSNSLSPKVLCSLNSSNSSNIKSVSKSVGKETSFSAFYADELFDIELDYEEEDTDLDEKGLTVPESSVNQPSDTSAVNGSLEDTAVDEIIVEQQKMVRNTQEITQSNIEMPSKGEESLSEGELTHDSDSETGSTSADKYTEPLMTSTVPGYTNSLKQENLIFPIFSPKEERNIWFVKEDTTSEAKSIDKSDRCTTFLPTDEFENKGSAFNSDLSKPSSSSKTDEMETEGKYRKRGRGTFKFHHCSHHRRKEQKKVSVRRTKVSEENSEQIESSENSKTEQQPHEAVSYSDSKEFGSTDKKVDIEMKKKTLEYSYPKTTELKSDQTGNEETFHDTGKRQSQSRWNISPPSGRRPQTTSSSPVSSSSQVDTGTEVDEIFGAKKCDKSKTSLQHNTEPKLSSKPVEDSPSTNEPRVSESGSKQKNTNEKGSSWGRARGKSREISVDVDISSRKNIPLKANEKSCKQEGTKPLDLRCNDVEDDRIVRSQSTLSPSKIRETTESDTSMSKGRVTAGLEQGTGAHSKKRDSSKEAESHPHKTAEKSEKKHILPVRDELDCENSSKSSSNHSVVKSKLSPLSTLANITPSFRGTHSDKYDSSQQSHNYTTSTLSSTQNTESEATSGGNSGAEESVVKRKRSSKSRRARKTSRFSGIKTNNGCTKSNTSPVPESKRKSIKKAEFKIESKTEATRNISCKDRIISKGERKKRSRSTSDTARKSGTNHTSKRDSSNSSHGRQSSVERKSGKRETEDKKRSKGRGSSCRSRKRKEERTMKVGRSSSDDCSLAPSNYSMKRKDGEMVPSSTKGEKKRSKSGDKERSHNSSSLTIVESCKDSKSRLKEKQEGKRRSHSTVRTELASKNETLESVKCSDAGTRDKKKHKDRQKEKAYVTSDLPDTHAKKFAKEKVKSKSANSSLSDVSMSTSPKRQSSSENVLSSDEAKLMVEKSSKLGKTKDDGYGKRREKSSLSKNGSKGTNIKCRDFSTDITISSDASATEVDRLGKKTKSSVNKRDNKKLGGYKHTEHGSETRYTVTKIKPEKGSDVPCSSNSQTTLKQRKEHSRKSSRTDDNRPDSVKPNKMVSPPFETEKKKKKDTLNGNGRDVQQKQGTEGSLRRRSKEKSAHSATCKNTSDLEKADVRHNNINSSEKDIHRKKERKYEDRQNKKVSDKSRQDSKGRQRRPEESISTDGENLAKIASPESVYSKTENVEKAKDCYQDSTKRENKPIKSAYKSSVSSKNGKSDSDAKNNLLREARKDVRIDSHFANKSSEPFVLPRSPKPLKDSTLTTMASHVKRSSSSEILEDSERTRKGKPQLLGHSTTDRSVLSSNEVSMSSLKSRDRNKDLHKHKKSPSRKSSCKAERTSPMLTDKEVSLLSDDTKGVKEDSHTRKYKSQNSGSGNSVDSTVMGSRKGALHSSRDQSSKVKRAVLQSESQSAGKMVNLLQDKKRAKKEAKEVSLVDAQSRGTEILKTSTGHKKKLKETSSSTDQGEAKEGKPRRHKETKAEFQTANCVANKVSQTCDKSNLDSSEESKIKRSRVGESFHTKNKEEHKYRRSVNMKIGNTSSKSFQDNDLQRERIKEKSLGGLKTSDRSSSDKDSETAVDRDNIRSSTQRLIVPDRKESLSCDTSKYSQNKTRDKISSRQQETATEDRNLAISFTSVPLTSSQVSKLRTTKRKRDRNELNTFLDPKNVKERKRQRITENENDIKAGCQKLSASHSTFGSNNLDVKINIAQKTNSAKDSSLPGNRAFLRTPEQCNVDVNTQSVTVKDRQWINAVEGTKSGAMPTNYDNKNKGKQIQRQWQLNSKDNNFLSLYLPKVTVKKMNQIQNHKGKSPLCASVTFQPREGIEGHIFRRRHINQLFIRGDNVVMVACDQL